jgi:transposase InsO family protein
MSRMFCLWFGLLVRVFRSRRSLLLENLALRQQLTVLKRKHPKPKLRVLDKLFWVIAAMDFFTVPTVTFKLLYCFFIISHDRRQILHCNVTQHPTSGWIGQQLREAFPYEASHKYLIHDRDAKFGLEVFSGVKSVGLDSVRTSFRSPWQNGVAERWVGSCRRDLLDHVIALNERHLKRLLSEYVLYYHEDRTHLGLGKDTPGRRAGQ